jgi:hypothetical protein
MDLGTLIFLIVWSGLGVVLIIWPRKIQQLARDHQERWPELSRFNPFRSWVESGIYTLTLRMFGLLIISVVIMIALRW